MLQNMKLIRTYVKSYDTLHWRCARQVVFTSFIMQNRYCPVKLAGSKSRRDDVFLMWR